MLANRLRKNLRNLKSWRAREGVECFRAYDADLPEYAAAIDVYPEADDPDTTWLHVQEYAAPAAIPEADVRRRFGEVLAAAREVLDRKSVVSGKSVSVRVDLGGRRIVKKKTKTDIKI